MTASRAFGFVQFEFPGRIGPAPGRYVVRRYAGDDAQHVVVIAGAASRAPGLFAARGRRKPRAAAPEPAIAAVEVTRATVVEAEPLRDPASWLTTAAADETAANEASRVLNRAIAAHRLGSADPYVPDLSPGRAIVVRVGYGAGEEVADGRWTDARELPPPAQPRGRLLQPQERAAALLGGRDAALACEELLLRARMDLDQGREREAALVGEAALRVACAELAPWRATGDIGARLEEIGRHHARLREVAAAAVEGGLEREQAAAVDAALERLAAALRARLASLRL